MICITKAEAKFIREQMPKAHIRRTAHKYYMEESPKAMAVLRKRNAEKG